MTEKTHLKTLKVRIKDKHKPVLERMTFEVNQVWNAANEITANYSCVPVPEVGWIRNSFSAFDLQKDLKSIKAERGFVLHSTTVQEVIAVHHKARRQFKTDQLRWRVSGGSRRSLGWVPFKSGAAKWKNGQVYFAGHYFKVWDSYGLSQFAFRSGLFSQDARGRWYFNIVVECPIEVTQATQSVGIDLGLKDTAT
ncbi:MAG: transposase, partial [Thiothrix sp.]